MNIILASLLNGLTVFSKFLDSLGLGSTHYTQKCSMQMLLNGIITRKPYKEYPLIEILHRIPLIWSVIIIPLTEVLQQTKFNYYKQ